MKLLEVKTLRGPNYWSTCLHQIIEGKLDIEELEESPTNKIEGFADHLLQAMPSLNGHFCSEGCEGGFLKRVREGTWMAHVVEHIALELQCLAGMECAFGRTRTAGQKGIYYVAFSYEVAQAGRFALRSALRVIEHLTGKGPNTITEDIEELKILKSIYGVGVSTGAILEEARRRNIPVRKMDEGSMYIFGHGVHQRRIKASLTCGTSGIGIDTASDKEQTKRMLYKAYVPVPDGELAATVEEMKDTVEFLKFPLVMKPLNGNHGKGVTLNIQTAEEALAAFNAAQAISKSVLIERYIQGYDCRLLVVDHKFVAAARRVPATVTGNGSYTIKQLVEQLNKDPNRGKGHAKVLTAVTLDAVSEKLLAQRGMTFDSVPEPGEVIFLKDTANLSTGGTSIDVTEQVHPANIRLAERISRLINLDICGIDVIAKDITRPLSEDNGCVIEVNACPGLRMHLHPSQGKPRNIAEPIVSMLFPKGAPTRIPLIAVTGTNGKTTTTRLLAHIAKTAGRSVGYTTTDGIYIQDECVYTGDCTGELSAESVLTDPIVDFAVLECARGGILRSGLGFDQCDISIVTNVSEDHLGLDGIHTLADMAKIKAVVAESTAKDGFAILNAEDDESFFIGDKVDSHIALFSLDPRNPRVIRHCERGGIAAYVEDGQVVVRKGNWTTSIAAVKDIPLTLCGRAECMTKNVLPAVLAATIQDFGVEVIRKALFSFLPSPESTPGRFNIFPFGVYSVMVDYAHNPQAMIELKKFIDRTEATHKVGIIGAPGDRRDEEISGVGFYAAQMFDEIIIRLDEDLRGRTAEAMVALLKKGIARAKVSKPVHVIAKEHDAILFAMSRATGGTFITTLTETVSATLAFLKGLGQPGNFPVPVREQTPARGVASA